MTAEQLDTLMQDGADQLRNYNSHEGQTMKTNAELLQKWKHEADRIAQGKECPECHSTDTESNGATEYRCRDCDHRWGTEYGARYGY